MIHLGAGFPINLDRLISTRLLVQASSGGGKSWCLRRILEQTHGHVQQLVIDPEGEFASLRERFDYVLASPKGGDTAADPRTAALLAERLLELRVSAILDLYDMMPRDRPVFVQRFLVAIIEADRKLWHPALILLDEAHVFAPEKGDAVSADAVAALMSRGRKRGFCGGLATQRLSSLSKDAAAQCQNVLIGRTTLDTDMKRAAYSLGFTGKHNAQQLRDLDDGEFFAYGPALSRAVTKVRVGPVLTTHPKAGGKQAFKPPPPTAQVKALLPQLADLPAEAEAREKSVADLKAELAQARREIAAAKRAQPTQPVAKAERVEVPVVLPAAVKALTAACAQLERAAAKLAQHGETIREDGQRAMSEGSAIRVALMKATPAPSRAGTPPPAVRVVPPARQHAVSPGNGDARLGGGERIVLVAVAQYTPSNGGATREQVSVLTGYKRSTRDAYLKRLGTRGFVEVGIDRVLATDSGFAVLGNDYTPLPIGNALRAYWLARLPEGERRCLEALPDHPVAIEREAVGDVTGYKRSTRDAYLGRLAARRLVEPVGRGQVRACAELFG